MHPNFLLVKGCVKIPKLDFVCTFSANNHISIIIRPMSTYVNNYVVVLEIIFYFYFIYIFLYLQYVVI